ncbi:MAG: monooxygenase [Campylobacter sp.]|nr:monooxygenase [Campylobacter sp.]
MVILQVDFNYDGGFGDEMAKELESLAHSITKEKGFLWKIWTENEDEKIAGGIYAFNNTDNAKAYAKMHEERLLKFPIISNFRAKVFDINETLSEITNAKKFL